MSEAVRDGGRQDSRDGIRLFVQEWNAGNRVQIECPGAPKPAVVKIPRCGGEVRVWVKPKRVYVKTPVWLTPSGTIENGYDFLVAVHFADAERTRAEFYIMSCREVEDWREGPRLRKDKYECKKGAWDALESAVQR